MCEDKPKRFVVNRSAWRFGGIRFENIFDETSLLNDRGYRCCLGFVASQLGVPDEHLLDAGSPRYAVSSPGAARDMVEQKMDGVLIDRTSAYSFKESDLTREAVLINDECFNREICKNREQKLIETFAKHGFELVFEGDYTEKQKQALAAYDK